MAVDRLARAVVEAGPSLRWHRGRWATRLLHRRAFADIGEGTVIVAPLALRGVERISIGARTNVYAGAWLATEGSGRLRLGDDNYLGHAVHLHAIDDITIGDGCVFADGVFAATSDHDRDRRAAVHGTGPISVGDRVFIGQRAVVLGGVTIGDGATVGAHAVVTRDVPAGAVVAGVPAREVR